MPPALTVPPLSRCLRLGLKDCKPHVRISRGFGRRAKVKVNATIKAPLKPPPPYAKVVTPPAPCAGVVSGDDMRLWLELASPTPTPPPAPVEEKLDPRPLISAFVIWLSRGLIDTAHARTVL
jgi:hypothetical protein